MLQFNLKSIFSKRPYLLIGIIVAIVYMFLVNHLVQEWSYFLNPDGYSYLTIALKFKSLNPHNILLAFNALWSPLFPILCTFFLDFFPYIKALKIANAFTGILSLVAFLKMLQRFKVKPFYALLLTICAITSSLWIAFTVVAPDQLVTAIVIIYTLFLLDEKYLKESKYALLCGLFGFIAFITKQYAFYFFIMHFTFVHLVYLRNYWKTNEKKQIIQRYLLGMCVFLVLTLFLTILLSYRYKTFTIETSSKLNIFLLLKSKQRDFVLTDNGLIPPSNDTAVNAFEDLTLITDTSHGEFMPLNKFLELIILNTKKIYFTETGFKLSFIVVILFVIYLRKNNKNTENNMQLNILLWSYFIFPLGYIVLYTEFRYLFYMYYLMLTMLGVMLSSAYFDKTKLPLKILILSVLVMILYKPISSFNGRGINQAMFDTINDLKLSGYFQEGDKFASNSNYFGTTALAYQLGGKYYGQFPEGQENTASSENIETALDKYHIKHYIIWLDHGSQYIPKGFTIGINYADKDQTMLIIVKRY